MFGRATIRLGIGPHSSFVLFSTIVVNKDEYKNDKHPLSMTNPRDALHRGKRAANKGGRSL